MMFLQSSLNEIDSLPITREVAKKAIRKYGNSLMREVADSAWPQLRKFATPTTYLPKDESHQQLLFLLDVFEYMNDQPWYQVNPVVATLPKFNEPA
jgi:hypothetical protein